MGNYFKHTNGQYHDDTCQQFELKSSVGQISKLFHFSFHEFPFGHNFWPLSGQMNKQNIDY